ncbi:MAG: hypothetical protein A2508_07920 [Candidatus Lambdaproteobacteria bacterium RIFOXYD12_FULL_49_8]|nr:MAG: hypothetical protein A2508_07920 [Candidatus Lambdaproteobacteria bacterium RIFOXYD12_FULL_49_8]
MTPLVSRALGQFPLGTKPLLAWGRETLGGPILSANQEQGVQSYQVLGLVNPLASRALNLAPLSSPNPARVTHDGIWRIWQHQPLTLLDTYHAQYVKKLMVRVRYEGALFVTLNYNGLTRRVSNETIDGGQYLWLGKLSSLSPIRLAAQGDGGFVKLSWGQVGFTPDCFINSQGQVILPPRKLAITAQWGIKDDPEYLSLAFEGEAILRQVSEEELFYDVVEKEWPMLALEEGPSAGQSLLVETVSSPNAGILRFTTGFAHNYAVGDVVFLQPVSLSTVFDYSGKWEILAVDPLGMWFEVAGNFSTSPLDQGMVSAQIVARPLALGALQHIPLIRTGFGDIDVLYFRPNLAGVLGTDWHIYDDGVLADNYWAPGTQGESLIERNPAYQPQGTLTASGQACVPGSSGTQSFCSLADLFTWAAQLMGLTLINPNGGLVLLDFIYTDQIPLIDLLDQVAGYAGYLFYIQGSQLILIDRQVPQGQIDNLSALKLVDLKYQYELPVKEYRGEWSQLIPRQEQGLSVMREQRSQVVLEGAERLGETKKSRVFHRHHQGVRSRLKAAKVHWEKPPVTLITPLDRLARLGEQFTYLDNQLDPPRSVTAKVEVIELDFNQDLLSVTGRAEII